MVWRQRVSERESLTSHTSHYRQCSVPIITAPRSTTLISVHSLLYSSGWSAWQRYRDSLRSIEHQLGQLTRVQPAAAAARLMHPHFTRRWVSGNFFSTWRTWAVFTMGSPMAVSSICYFARTGKYAQDSGSTYTGWGLGGLPLFVLFIPLVGLMQLRDAKASGGLHSDFVNARYGWLCSQTESISSIVRISQVNRS